MTSLPTLWLRHVGDFGEQSEAIGEEKRNRGGRCCVSKAAFLHSGGSPHPQVLPHTPHSLQGFGLLSRGQAFYWILPCGPLLEGLRGQSISIITLRYLPCLLSLVSTQCGFPEAWQAAPWLCCCPGPSSGQREYTVLLPVLPKRPLALEAPLGLCFLPERVVP